MTDYYKESAPWFPSPKYSHRFTSQDIKDLCAEQGCGIFEAKQILMRRQIMEDINNGRRTQNVVLLYDLLEYMLENVFKS
jgi:hypothetical protein